VGCGDSFPPYSLPGGIATASICAAGGCTTLGATVSSELVALSDLHLGTRHCRAERLLELLDTIDTRRLVLCGDVIDFIDPGPRWPALHTVILERLLTLARDGMRVDLLCGNHDGILRAFLPTRIGDIHLADRLILELGGERVLFLHGDQVDHHCHTHPFLRRVGAGFYDGLMYGSHWVNALSSLWRGKPVSLVAAFRTHLPWAARHVDRFEQACAGLAAEADCSAVVCGHIHVPWQRIVTVAGKPIVYRNCGDWVEHTTGWTFTGAAWKTIGAIDVEPLPSLVHADGALGIPAEAALAS